MADAVHFLIQTQLALYISMGKLYTPGGRKCAPHLRYADLRHNCKCSTRLLYMRFCCIQHLKITELSVYSHRYLYILCQSGKVRLGMTHIFAIGTNELNALTIIPTMLVVYYQPYLLLCCILRNGAGRVTD